MSTDKPTDARERLRENFLDHDPKLHPSRWERLWSQNDLPWDKGFPSPALVDLLQPQHPHHNLLPTPVQGKRLRALVPGCGKGYDVLLLASFGYEAVGVEAAKTAVVAAESESEGWEEKYPVLDENRGRGSVKFVYGDFFEKGWEKEVLGDEGAEEGQWDLIYDYTFLCALPTALRPSWAKRMSSLLSPTGRLICLEFPTYKPPSAGGPPWAVRPETYLSLLTNPGQKPEYDEEGLPVWKEGMEKEKGEGALQRLEHWRPERTHKIGEGTDFVSVWGKL